MNAAGTIALIVQLAQLVGALSSALGFEGGAKAAEMARIVPQLIGIIDDAKKALKGDDLALLEAQLELIEPDVIALSNALDAALALAETR